MAGSFVANTGTFSGIDAGFTVNIGTAAADRIVVAVITYEDADTLDTVTIGGVACTQAVAVKHSGDNTVEIWYTNTAVASGTTATLIATHSGTSIDGGYSIYKLTGLPALPTDSGSAVSSAATTDLSTVTIPTGGFGIFGYSNDSTGAVTWGNATEDADLNNPTGGRHSSASTSIAGTPTVSATGSADDNALAGAAWGPVAPGGVGKNYGFIYG